VRAANELVYSGKQQGHDERNSGNPNKPLPIHPPIIPRRAAWCQSGYL